MKRIDEQVAKAFLAGRQRTFSKNTQVYTGTDGNVWLMLFGNPIARRDGDRIFITTSGWPTKTTLSRLNALPGVLTRNAKSIGGLHLNGKPWDGSWKEVSREEKEQVYRRSP